MDISAFSLMRRVRDQQDAELVRRGVGASGLLVADEVRHGKVGALGELGVDVPVFEGAEEVGEAISGIGRRRG
ncbi:MAG: hypothetical protein EA380_00385 [Phycisphaeraceae bacterium]|nr:MAG: hypothetical protein EA380_00385 [Phycisphaeraceae bacterium]